MVKNEESKKNDIILGLDISTACVGISIVMDNGVDEPEIIEITHVEPKIPKKIKGIEALILRKEIFEKNFLQKIKNIGVTECVIESPLNYATGNSNAQTVSQLLQFNGLLSESVYRVLGIIPTYISSYDARMYSFPELLAIRKFNKKGEIYRTKQIEKSLKTDHLVLFGAYPFDCEKKHIMYNLISEKYKDIKWAYDKDGNLKKQNFDACDSLVCVLAHVNKKRYGEMQPKVFKYSIVTNESGKTTIEYTTKIWEKLFDKKITSEA